MGISDILLSESESDKCSIYAIIYDKHGNKLTESEIYFIEEEEVVMFVLLCLWGFRFFQYLILIILSIIINYKTND